MKIDVSTDSSHSPFDEIYRVSCLRKNLTSSSEGEGLETDHQKCRASSLPANLGSKWQRDCEQLPAATGPDLPYPVAI